MKKTHHPRTSWPGPPRAPSRPSLAKRLLTTSPRRFLLVTAASVCCAILYFIPLTPPLPSTLTPALGSLDLKHRVVMAPMTRNRASKEGIVSEYSSTYYEQRATDGGLQITEGTLIASEFGGIADVPGIWNDQQVEAWRKVTEKVHNRGGKIVCQLWTIGRVANPNIVDTIYAPSDIPYSRGSKNLTVMTVRDIDRLVEHYRKAAVNAVSAGFDGVEVHMGDGYLIDQFIQNITNHRPPSDPYTPHTFLLPLRILRTIASALPSPSPSNMLALRISPWSTYQGMETFAKLVEGVLGEVPEVAWVHVVRADPDSRLGGGGGARDELEVLRNMVRQKGRGTTAFMVAGGYDPNSAKQHAEETDDLVAFGRYYISNPDLVRRIANDYPLAEYDADTSFSHGPEGYIDYPEYGGRI
ncbi:hypothetical protein IAR50_004814 [Cryptococcus sp. DSM 104548]